MYWMLFDYNCFTQEKLDIEESDHTLTICIQGIKLFTLEKTHPTAILILYVHFKKNPVQWQFISYALKNK